MIRLRSRTWELKNIDTVLFDKDGTLIDLHYFWGKMTELRVAEIIKKYSLSDKLFAELCLKLGYDTDSGKMLSDGITALYSRSIIINIFCEDLKKLGIVISEQEMEDIFESVSKIFYADMIKYTRPIEPAITFVKELRKRGAKIGIVTSDSKESTLLTLKHFGWEDLFDVVIGRESTPETKESGVPVKMALHILGSNPENTVMIGDAPMDYLAANNAGVTKTILAATGQIEHEYLIGISEYTLKSLSEIQVY